MTAVIDATANITAVAGTFTGTFSGTTGSFSRLLTASAGISAAGGVTFAGTFSGATATFSGEVNIPLNTAPALKIGNHGTKNLVLSSTDGAALIEQGGNNTATLTIRQESGGTVTIGGSNSHVVVTDADSNITMQGGGQVALGDVDGVANGTNIVIDDVATTINAYAVSFGVNGRLDMNKGYSEAGATATQATNTITFDATKGNTQKFVPSAVVNTVNFTNINTASTQCTSATLIFLHGATPYGLTSGTFSVQLAGVTKTVKWSGGSAPTLTNTANKTDILNFLTYDGGTTWLGFVGGLNF
jgi:protein involved in ribonucleotide reduction